MNKEKISSGIGFILIGIIILLLNFHIIDWSILSVLFVLWPLFFVVIGLNIIFSRVPLAKAAVWVLFVVVILYFTINIDDYPFIKKSQLNYFVPITYDKVELKETKFASQNEKLGDLQFNVGIAGDVSIHSGDTSELATIWAPSEGASITHDPVGNKGIIHVDDNHASTVASNKDYNYDIMLNPTVEWDINLQTGVISGDFDLQDVLINNLTLKTGAGDMNLKIGRVTENATVNVSSGVASLDLVVDPSIGVCIKQRSVIQDDNFKEGWYKQNDAFYSTNYQEAAHKVTITIESAISDIQIEH